MLCYQVVYLFLVATLMVPSNSVTTNGTVGKIMEIYVNHQRSITIPFAHIKDPNPFRIEIWREGPVHYLEYDVLVVLQQNTKVTSWQIPYVLPTSYKDDYTTFGRTSKILCNDEEKSKISLKGLDRISERDRNFTIHLTTRSLKNITVFVYAELFKDFFIKDNEPHPALISPSQPIYYSYEFRGDADDEESVALTVNSEKDACVIVSVQQKLCPVEDYNFEMAPGGLYQTIKSKGGMRISKRLFPNGFYLAFNVKPDNQSCNLQELEIHGSKFPGTGSINISFKIDYGRTKTDYNNAIRNGLLPLIPIIFFLIIWCLTRKYGGLQNQAHSEPKYPVYTLIIAVFYCLPVFLLMNLYKKMVDDSGNLDKCYYNFLCSHPYYFHDLNHMFSNISYLCYAILFTVVVWIKSKFINNGPECGLDREYGIYYAMSVALFFEGILSCIYHICPNESNFQYDTSFMYVMVVLNIAKLYQNRHVDQMNKACYKLFGTLAFIVFFVTLDTFTKTLEGVRAGKDAQYYTNMIFNTIHVLLILYIARRYYFGEIEPNVPNQHQIIRGKRILTSMQVIINFVLVIFSGSLVSYTDFGSYVLLILVLNAIIYCVYYISMKLYLGERVCIEAKIYALLSPILWSVASFFFFNSVTAWAKTPAESREMNSECILWGFYDTHDIWHMLSAPALFCSFMFLLTIDDDLRRVPRNDITIF